MGIKHQQELLQLYLNKASSVSWLEHLRQNWTQTGPSLKTVQNNPPVRQRHGLSSLFFMKHSSMAGKTRIADLHTSFMHVLYANM